MTERPRIRARYRLLAAADQIERLARFIAYEQTVELPETLVQDPQLVEQVVGRVEATRQLDERHFEATISYSAELASNQVSQLLNLLYGNVSMLDGIRLVGVDLPASLLAQCAGPRHGIAGLRRLTGVFGRPLLATAVKPRGMRRRPLQFLG